MLLNKFHEAFPESEDIPQFKTVEVWMLLTQLKTNKSTIKGDISVITFREFVAHITKPLTHVYNTSLVQGEYPKIYKYEISTPITKNPAYGKHRISRPMRIEAPIPIKYAFCIKRS